MNVKSESVDVEEIESAPFLAVADMRETIKWYQDKLGFGVWFESDTTSGLDRGDFVIRLEHNPKLAAQVRAHQKSFWEGHWVWIEVDPIKRLYLEHQQRGASIVEPLTPRSIGYHEYDVLDPNGYLLRFVSQIDFRGDRAGDGFDEQLLFDVIDALTEEYAKDSSWIFSEWLETADELEIDLSSAMRDGVSLREYAIQKGRPIFVELIDRFDIP